MPQTPTNVIAALQVTGALPFYCGVGQGAGLRFLGWTNIKGLRWRTHYGWVPFFADLGGPVISYDDIFANQEVFVSVDLAIFRQDTLFAVESVPNPLGVPFVNPFGDIGGMAVTEGLAYPIFWPWPYTQKAIARAAGMPPGLLFGASILVGPSGYTGGTVPREINLVWKCKSVRNPKTGAFTCGVYTSVSGLPAAA